MNVLIPYDYIERKSFLNGDSNEKCLIYDQNMFSFETRFLIKKLFQIQVEALKNYQKLEESFYMNKNFSIKEVFDSISINKMKYLLVEDVYNS